MAERDCVCADCGREGKTLRPHDPVYCPDCLDAKLKPGQRVVTCVRCGAVGIEDADDPCPGICPDCLEGGLMAATGLDLRAEISEMAPQEVTG